MAKNWFAEAVAKEPAAKQFKGASKDQARNDYTASFYGRGGSTPLSEFQSSKNTRYAMDKIGWDKSQGLRRDAEAADAANPEAAPTGGNKWDRRYNYANDEMEWKKKEDSNFWTANKRELIQMGAMTLGGVLLGPGGMMLGRSLAQTGMDIHDARKARRAARADRRDFNYEQAQQSAAEDEARRANMGNLFRSGGEGVIEYATKDLSSKKRDQYVRRPYNGENA